MKSVAFFSLLILFLQLTPAAQTPYDDLDFTEVDNYAGTVKFQGSLTKLAKELGTPYPADIYKVRAIFKWITNNIAYDYRFINKGKEIVKPECGDQVDCPTILREWEEAYLMRILKTRKTVAEGYAKLFKKLCDLNYVQSEMIQGYARTRPYQIGNSMGVNHSWNAVMIDTSWYYLDVTWAAGYCIEDPETGILTRFVKDFRNYYWLSLFDRFSRNHYPQNNRWVVRPNFSKEQFFNKPHYFTIEILENLYETIPSTGVLKVKKGDTIHFKFEYRKEINKLQINSNVFRNPSLWTTVQLSRKKTKIVRDTWAEKKQVYIPYKKNGNVYEFDYVVKESSLYYLELSFDYKPAIRYRVRVEG